jgi:ABC-2 type transport system ATP-binding protein
MIEAHELSKYYGDYPALDRASFKVKQGQIVGFLGPNGAGKTTTLRILTGYMPPTSGWAKIANFDVTREALDARQHIGYLPEKVPLYPDMTAQGYLEFMAGLRGLAKKRQAAQRALEKVGLAPRARSLVRHLSKGMRQRLGLAGALIHEPPVLILDEPTIGLDPQQVRDVRALVRDLGQNHTVIFSTHILSEAEQICDSVIIIQGGRIVAQDSPTQLRDRLQVNGRVYLRGRGPQQKLLDLVAKVNGVAEVAPYQDGVVVRPKNGQEIRPALAEALAKNNIALLELRPLASSLEDIFLELTELGGTNRNA